MDTSPLGKSAYPEKTENGNVSAHGVAKEGSGGRKALGSGLPTETAGNGCRPTTPMKGQVASAPLIGVRTNEETLTFVETVIAEVRGGMISPKTANTLGCLLNVRLHCLQIQRQCHDHRSDRKQRAIATGPGPGSCRSQPSPGAIARSVNGIAARTGSWFPP